MKTDEVRIGEPGSFLRFDVSARARDGRVRANRRSYLLGRLPELLQLLPLLHSILPQSSLFDQQGIIPHLERTDDQQQ